MRDGVCCVCVRQMDGWMRSTRGLPVVACEREVDDLPCTDRDLCDDFTSGGRDRLGQRDDVVLLWHARHTDDDGVEPKRFLRMLLTVRHFPSVSESDTHTLMAFIVIVRDSRSSIVNSFPPRAVIRARTLRISSRMRAWYSWVVDSS